MQGLDEALKTEINVLGALLYKFNCSNTSEYLYRNRESQGKDFLDGALKALYTDVRTMRFGAELSKMNPKFTGIMRKSTLSSLDLLCDRISQEPGRMARYRRIGLKPFDVERNWYLARFNSDVTEITKVLPSASEDPERFVKCSFKLFSSFAKNIYKPYSEIYKDCVRNILGSRAKELPSLIEENFSMDSVYLVGGRPMCDLRYIRKMYREKKYRMKGTKISFEGVDPSMPRIEYNVWDLVFMVLFLQVKVLVLSSVFCIIDVEKMRQMKVYLAKQ